MKFKWDDTLTPEQNVRRHMSKVVRRYFKAGQRAFGKKSSWDEIHEFRLMTKQFRYTLELFLPVYGDGLDVRLQQIRKLQTLLGDLNDCSATRDLLKKVDGMEAARDKLEARGKRKERELRKYWESEFAIDGAVADWTTALGAPKSRQQ